MKLPDTNLFKNIFFMGIAGAGMSALAQYFAGKQIKVSGSDRRFDKQIKPEIFHILSAQGIQCFPQNASGINSRLDAVIVSAAVEKSVPEYQAAKNARIPIYTRAELLAALANTHTSIAVAGTSGKSTVAAMIFHILQENGKNPSLITGAALSKLKNQKASGNAYTGTSDILVIEADESDGSIINYKPHTGIILNIEKDHKSIPELEKLFARFADNVRENLIVNADHKRTAKLSLCSDCNFGSSGTEGFSLNNFEQENFGIRFKINGTDFKLKQIGKHNAENYAAAAAAAACFGISLEAAGKAAETYTGISRRSKLVGQLGGITLIDDYAHNPAKIQAAINACIPISDRLFVWFQPHGFGPTRFLKNEFTEAFAQSLRPEDMLILSDIYYAGGTADKNISSAEIVSAVAAKGLSAAYLPERIGLFDFLNRKLMPGDTVLLTGARDPSLGAFAKNFFDKLRKHVG